MSGNGTYRALLIGNSTFPNDSQNLQPLEGPVNDVALLRDALTDRETGMFEAGNVRMVPERTMSEILIELETFFTSASRDDRLLLYYSGHGLLTLDNQLLLCARDTRTDVARATAVSAAAINMMIESSSATGTVIMLDCCYSGSFKSGALPDSLRGSGRFLLTSTRGGQLANDADRRNGTSLFTQYVVDALRGGAEDRDGDGFIDLDELYDYVYKRLRDGGRQLPQRNFSGHGDLAIARRTSRVVTPTPPPPLPPPPPSPPQGADETPPPTAPDAEKTAEAAATAEPESLERQGVPKPERPTRLRPRPKLSGKRRVVAALGVGLGLALVVGAVVALTGGDGGPELGPASLEDPRHVAVAPDGSLYIVDAGSNRLLRRHPNGTIETVASPGVRVRPADGSAPVEAGLNSMHAVAVDPRGEVVFGADGTLFRLGQDGQIRGVPFNVLGVSYAVAEALAFDRDGSILAAVGDDFATAVLRVLPDGTTVNVAGAGSGPFSGDGGPASAARFRGRGIAVDRGGNLYIADAGNHRVRRIDADGVISTIAGNGDEAWYGDGGPAVEAAIDYPAAVAIDREGALYVADARPGVVRVVRPGGAIDLFAGSGVAGVLGDGGPATSANLSEPIGLAVDASGTVYVSDRGNRRVRSVSREGTISTVA